MLNSLLLAGVLLTLSNFLPTVVPTAQATLPAPQAVILPPAPQAAANTNAPSLIAYSGPMSLMLPASYSPSSNAERMMNSQEREFVSLINQERTSRGENALIVDPLLVAIARSHSEEMSRLNYFDHCSPTPGIKTPMDRYLDGLHEIGEPTPSYLLVGENIYYCSVYNSQYNVAYGHEALMHSPGHRANILEPRFTKIGVGVYHSASGQFWVTEEFVGDKP